MPRTGNSFYINAHGPDEKAIRTGFNWLSGMGSSVTALLAVPQKQNLQGPLAQFLGTRNVSGLKANNQIRVNNASLSLLTVRQRAAIYQWNAPILAFYPNENLLNKIDGLIGAIDVLVVPWIFDKVQWWIDTWGAVELGTASQSVIPPHLAGTPVESALQKLTTAVNLSSGITHPSDHNSAIECFRNLRKNGTPFSPDEVRMWLVAIGGWNPEHADKVKGIAEAISQGRKLRKK